MPKQPSSGVLIGAGSSPTKRQWKIMVKGRLELTRGACLQNFGAAEKNGVLVSPIYVEVFGPIENLDGLLQKRGRFAGKHGLVYDASAMYKEDISGNGGLTLLAC